ncbi:S-layer homology domain-containing protein [Psychrobacillus vulpis]|uniref:SLH domain-containing protein n=1 Tax=Psychrobacillus vulpis TaxID=2325572 RepID=A0A544TVC8_9BACI|nr:S-layer homology domain-containing protein [Psychrobacillus vulpis]TQR21395.1 hypothetical protein FG384_00025 [Psychrobacillus vulpis]
MRLKKFGIILTSSALTFGMFSSIASASTSMNEQPKQVQFASTEKVISKTELIKKFQELFPKKFDFLSSSDFHMNSGNFFQENDQLRYDLSFTKVINGKRVYGNVSFVGEELEMEQFYYQPPVEKDALFPAKVSKEEARKIADDFVKEFLGGEEYQLETDPEIFFPSQILTEPIRYSFSFTSTKNQVSISDQTIGVSVLGNGEIVNLYRNPIEKNVSTFDDVKQVKDKNEILEKVKENLSVDLQYQVNTDYRTGERSVQLVYQPTTKLRGVQASTGKWLTANGYSEDIPKSTKIEKLSANPLPPKQNGVTLEQAKKIAEQFLNIKSDKVKLNIESINEIKNYNGQEVISVQYMYQYASGGSGTHLEINKKTGEIVQYSDMKTHILEQLGETPKKENALTQEEALTKAVGYLKEWVPSYLHNYAMPFEEAYFEERQGIYQFSFPRIVNGIAVIGDQINVSIAGDGSLNSLNVSYQEEEKWPSIDKVISEENAKAILQKTLSLKLNYMKSDTSENKHHYDLVYLPVFNEDSFSFLDANTGKWSSLFDEKNSSSISHPWAQEELNYLIKAKVLDIKDTKKFNGDASVTKGEALKIIINSLTYFYEDRYNSEQEDKSQTFNNIDSKHPLYQVIERAVEMGIIQPNSKGFDVDAPIKREELAAWYIRILGLEQAAKHSSIYKLDFADANKIQNEYIGYVALVNSMGLLEADKKHFNPDREVTYAELAVSTIRLAHEISEKGNELRY